MEGAISTACSSQHSRQYDLNFKQPKMIADLLSEKLDEPCAIKILICKDSGKRWYFSKWIIMKLREIEIKNGQEHTFFTHKNKS